MDVAGFGGFILNLQRGSTGRRSFRRIPACARVLLVLCYVVLVLDLINVQLLRDQMGARARHLTSVADLSPFCG